MHVTDVRSGCFLLPLVSVLVNGARQEKHKYAKNELYQTLTDNILGVSDWVFSQRGSEFVARYETDEANVRALDEKMKQFNRGRDFVLQLLFGVIAIAVLAWTSVRFQVIMGAQPIGLVPLF